MATLIAYKNFNSMSVITDDSDWSVSNQSPLVPGDSITFSDPTGGSNKAMRLHLNSTNTYVESGTNKVKARLQPTLDVRLAPYVDYWFGWRYWMPTDYPSNAGGIIGLLDPMSGGSVSECLILTYNGKISITRQWQSGGALAQDKLSAFTNPRGRWISFVVHYRRGWTTSNLGAYEVWCDSAVEGTYALMTPSSWANALTSMDKAAVGLPDPAYRFGHYRPYVATDPTFNFVGYWDDLRIAVGTPSDGFDTVDPLNTGQVVTPPDPTPGAPTAPDGATSISHLDAGFSSTGGWASANTTATDETTELYVNTESVADAATATWAWTAVTGTDTVWIYAPNKADRTAACPVTITNNGSVLYSGTFSQQNAENLPIRLGKFNTTAGPIDVTITNAGSGFTAANKVWHLSEVVTPVSSDISYKSGSVAKYASGTGTTQSVDVPVDAAVGDVCLIVFTAKLAADISPQGVLSSEKICTGLKKGSSNRSQVAILHVIDGTETSFTATQTSSDWYAFAMLLSNVDTSTLFDVRESSHVNNASGTYHTLGTNTNAPTAANITTTTADAAVLTISTMADDVSGTCSGCTVDKGTKIFENVTTAPFSCVSLEVVATPGVCTGATHTYTGYDASADYLMLVFSLKKAGGVSAATLDFPVQGNWVSQPTSLSRNGASITYDAVVASGVSGGTSPYFVAASATDGCSVSVSGHDVTVTPSAGFAGNSHHEVTITDSGSPVEEATRTVTIAVANTAPTATNQAKTVEQNTVTNIDMTGFATSPYGVSLTYDLVTASNGGVSGVMLDATTLEVTTSTSGGTLTFTADDGANVDNLSNVANIVFTAITPAHDPLPADLPLTCYKNSEANTLDVVASSTDLDGLALTITHVNGSACTAGGSVAITNGTVYNVNNKLVFVPTAEWTGTEAFTYTLSNGTYSANGTVTITCSAEPINSTSTEGTGSVNRTIRTVTGNFIDDYGLSTILGIEEIAYEDVSVTEGSVTLAGDDYEWTIQEGGAFRVAEMTVTATFNGVSAPVTLKRYVVVAGSAPNVRGVNAITGRRIR